MAKKKKTKTKKSRKSPEENSREFPDEDFLTQCLKTLQCDDRAGIELVRAEPEESDETLRELLPLLNPEEQKILSTSGAFGDVSLREPALDDISEMYCLRKCCEISGTPAPPVPVHGGETTRTESTKVALGQELRHLNTILHPAEMKWFIAELTADFLEGAPVTHTDISDAVIASIVPSTAQKLALQADAQYKYTTAQFLQVYSKLRHVVLEHKIMQTGAKADATFLAASDIPIDPLTEQDKRTPVSAVDALQMWGNLLPMLPGFSGLGSVSESEAEEDEVEEEDEEGLEDEGLEGNEKKAIAAS